MVEIRSVPLHIPGQSNSFNQDTFSSTAVTLHGAGVLLQFAGWLEEYELQAAKSK